MVGVMNQTLEESRYLKLGIITLHVTPPGFKKLEKFGVDGRVNAGELGLL